MEIKMRKKRPAKKVSRVSGHFMNFLNQYVQLIGEFTMPQMDGQYATVSGYLISMDDEFYYLGPSLNEVNAAVKIDRVFSMQVVTKKTQAEEMLERWSPEEKDGPN